MNIINQLIRPLIWSTILAMAIYSTSLFIVDLKSMGSAMTKLGHSGWLIILSLSLLNYGLRFLRWQYYLSRFNYQIPIFANFIYYLSGFSFTATPGKVGEMIRLRYLLKQNVTHIHGMTAFFTERLLDLVVMTFLALSYTLINPDMRISFIIILLSIMGILGGLHCASLHRLLQQIINRLPFAKLQSAGKHFLNLLKSAVILLQIKPLCIGTMLGFLAWLAEAIAFYLILIFLDVNLSPLTAVSIYAVSVIAGALSLIPGGLGTTEATMTALLTLAGADASIAIAATLICRISTLWFAIAIGLLCISILEMHTTDKPSFHRRLKGLHHKS